MFVNAPDEVACDTYVQCSARSAREDVEIILGHRQSMTNRDGRDKPGHDGWEVPERAYKINLLKSAFFARSPMCSRT